MKTIALAPLACSLFVSAAASAQEPLPPLPPPSAQPAPQPAPSSQPGAATTTPRPATQYVTPPPGDGTPERRPSSGTGLIIAGAIMMGVGVVNLATSPLCKADFIDKKLQDPCFAAALIFGGVLVGVGVPLFIVGLNKNSDYNDWKKRHPVAAGFGLGAGSSQGALTFRAEF